MVDRIRQLMEYKGFTSTQLADDIEVPRATVSHILSGRNKPSLDVVLKIISCYREVAVDWLLFGEGEMLKSLVPDNSQKKEADLSQVVFPEAAANAAKEPTPPQKVQETPPAARAPISEGKDIEQVMVFYSDKTFTSYKPTP